MLIAESDQGKLRERFADELTGEVRLRLGRHAGECRACAQAGEILGEVAGLSDLLTVASEERRGPLPEIWLEGRARGEVRFVGLPSGYEFPALVDSIVDVSRGETSLSVETLARLGGLRDRVHIQVFTTPT